VAGFRHAAENARRAGFDGVEVHGANGYLLDQFLRDGCNTRTDPYGGPLPHRARLLLEVVDACAAVFGAGRVGVRLSPLNSYNGMVDSDPVAVTEFVAHALDARAIGYLHMMRADFFGAQHGDVVGPARRAFKGVLVGNMGYTPDEAESAVGSGALDAVAFGTAFLANPDLPERIRRKAALNAPDPSTFYSPGAKGYTDYPAMPTDPR
jgi:N-ethylmaleimide reductase